MRRGLFYIICIGILISFPACSVKKNNVEKIRDLSFAVLSEEEIPEELDARIKEKGKNAFKITYSDKGKLYIAQGYGRKETNGYSVEVTDCYETENAVYICMNLIGPAKEEKVIRTETSPYVVVKLDAIDKNVVFE